MIDKANTEKTTDLSFHIGPIRPPSEASSLLLQVTNGCTWNRCKFCNLYRHTKFSLYSVEEVKRDIDNIRILADKVMRHSKLTEAELCDSAKLKSAGVDNWDIDAINSEIASMYGEEQQSYYMVANWLVNGGHNVFLQDGNSMALAGGKLSEVIRYLKEKLPTISRITSYGRAQNLARVSAEDFKELKKAGLDRIHSGYESGSDAVLKMVNKGATSKDQITAGKNIKAAGIELSVYFMPGLGGKELGDDNAIGMAEVVNACQPDYVRMRTAAVKPDTDLYQDLLSGVFTLAGDDDKVGELRLFLENANFDGFVVSDHIINLLPDIQGYMGKDNNKIDAFANRAKNASEYMIGIIDDYLAMPEEKRRIYQLLRRTIRAERISDLSRCSSEETEALEKKVMRYGKEEWDLYMNELISNYI